MEQWSSRMGFLLAAIGAAVGLGNIWRFPAVVGENGGGAYLVPYLIAAAGFAIPLMILEISVGRSLRADIVSACRQIREEYEIIGWLIGGSVLAVLSYYLVITGWVLAFFVFAIAGVDTSFATLTSSNLPLLFFIISTGIVGIIVSLGVKSGIERMATILIPLTFVILLGLMVYVAFLDGFGAGLDFFLTPDMAVLSDPIIWSAAFGQVFFSFSVGMGVLLTYGSYLDATTTVPKSAIMIAIADLAVAIISGIIIFSIVFTFHLEPSSGTELAFVTLPVAFGMMPFGEMVAILFFGLLFVAALAPSVSMLEVGVAGSMRATDWSRRKASVVMTALILLAGLPSALSYSAFDLRVFGRPFLDVLDGTVGAYALPVGAIGIIIIFTWIQDDEAVRTQLPSNLLIVLVKYVVPAVLVVVTGLRLITDFDPIVWSRIPGASTLPTVHAAGGTVAIGLAIGLIGWGIYRWHVNEKQADHMKP